MTKPRKLLDFGSLPRDPDRDVPLVDLRDPQRTRADIVLLPEVDRRLTRITEEFRGRDTLARHGLAPKTRLLFVGPPGCGKTLCAEVLAEELGLPLLIARFDGIVSSYLGETAANLRQVFDYAGQRLSVLFFDEFDALGKRRDDEQDVGEFKRVVSSFLQFVDGYPRDHFVIAATNHAGLLDEALWRRFDEILHFARPTADELRRLVDLRLRGVRKRGVDLDEVVRGMDGFSFADAERVCLEATKAMHLAGRKELSQSLLDVELAEQRARIVFASG
jgi:SpoVK/Ycf46/Vps4 family AAA+-type ATPase